MKYLVFLALFAPVCFAQQPSTITTTTGDIKWNCNTAVDDKYKPAICRD